MIIDQEGETDAAMGGGWRETPYTFTTISSSAARLMVYPALELLNQKGWSCYAPQNRNRTSRRPLSPSILAIQPGSILTQPGGAGHMGNPALIAASSDIAPGTTSSFRAAFPVFSLVLRTTFRFQRYKVSNHNRFQQQLALSVRREKHE